MNAGEAGEGGKSPYSPSDPMEEDEDDLMDWSTNLTGVRTMLEGNSNSGETVSEAGNTATQPLPTTPADTVSTTKPADTVSKAKPAELSDQSSGSGQQTPEVLVTTPEQQTGAGPQTLEVQTGGTKAPNADILDIAERSRVYLKKAKEKKIKDLEDGLGADALPYKVVSAAGRSQLAAPDLKDKTKRSPDDSSTIFSEADGRIKLADIKVVLGQKKTWTYSFDSNTFECLGCEQHHNLLYFPRRGSIGRGARQTIWLADQSMPAAIPVTTTLGCVKIVRLENGSLMDLAEGLVELLSGRQVAAGSVILLTSASNMLAAGTAGYTQDLINAIHYLRRALGDHLLYGPLPNILFNGTVDEELVRINLEVGAWAKIAFAHNDALLSNSFELLENSMLGRGRGGGLQTDYRCRLRLPSHQNNPSKFSTWSSGGWGGFPKNVKPPTTGEETVLYHSMLQELRNNLALDLEPQPTIDRWPLRVYSVKETKKSFLIVGSSHASKSAAALQRAGYEVDLIYKPNWRALKNTKRDLSNELALEVLAILEEKKVDTVVFQLLDSNVYWALQEDGSTIAARSGPDKKFHMDGDIVISSKAAQHSLFNNLKPLFEAVNGKNFLLVTPLPRYLIDGCCSDAEHMPNRKLPGFEQQLQDDLRDVAQNFKDFLFTSGLKNGKIVNPEISLRGLQRHEIWDADPVHLRDAAYDKLAEGIIRVASNLEEAGKKRRRTDSLDGGRQAFSNSRGRGGDHQGRRQYSHHHLPQQQQSHRRRN
jgi:hypothetical protein